MQDGLGVSIGSVQTVAKNGVFTRAFRADLRAHGVIHLSTMNCTSFKLEAVIVVAGCLKRRTENVTAI